MKITDRFYNRNRWTYFLVLVIVFNISLGADAFTSGQRHHKQRNAGSYRRSVGSLPGTVNLQTLTNASAMTCSEAMALPNARLVHLLDDDMRGVMQTMGGSYIKDYMAATQEEAQQNFPNMIELTKPVSVPGSTSSFTTQDNIVSKQTIVDDLKKLTAYFMGKNATSDKDHTSKESLGSEHGGTETTFIKPNSSAEQSTPKPMNNSTDTRTDSAKEKVTTFATTTTNGKESRVKTSELLPNRTTASGVTQVFTNSSGLTISKDNLVTPTSELPQVVKNTSKTDGLKTAVLETTTTNVVSIGNAETTGSSTVTQKSSSLNLKSKTTTSPTTMMQTQSTKYTVTEETRTTTIDPDILSGLEQLKHYVEGSGTGRDLDTIWRSANTTLPPSTYLGLAMGKGRAKRNAGGSWDDPLTRPGSVEEYCRKKGDLTEDRKFVHLCSLCATTTRLPDDMFPRFINEAVCKTGDTDCFSIAGTSHGQCKQTKFSLNMLRKKPGHCKMLLHGGETLVFDNWELVPQRIRVSCECTINKLSVFSQYAAQDVPVG